MRRRPTCPARPTRATVSFKRMLGGGLSILSENLDAEFDTRTTDRARRSQHHALSLLSALAAEAAPLSEARAVAGNGGRELPSPDRPGNSMHRSADAAVADDRKDWSGDERADLSLGSAA